MSRDGVIRRHLDRLTEEDLPGAIRCSDSEAGSLGRMPKFRDSGCWPEPNRGQLWRAVIARQYVAAFPPFGFAGPSALTRVLRRMEHRHVLQVRKPAY